MQTNGRRKSCRNRRGSVIIWTAVAMFAFIGFLAMVCDVGYAMLCGARLQSAADAASLAGAAMVQTNQTSAASQAAAIALANHAGGVALQLAANPTNDPGGDVVIGVFNQSTGVFTPTLTTPNAVKVTTRLTAASANGAVKLLFGPALGMNTLDMTRTAVAMALGGPAGNPGIIVLDPHASGAANLTGYGNITEIGGNVQINSDSPTALTGAAYGTITAQDVDIVGGYSFTGSAQVVGQVLTGAPPLADPLASLPAPAASADLGKVNLTGKQGATLNPGYYSGGITASGQGAVTLKPGIYVLNGAGLVVNGGGQFTANGVTIYITGTGGLNLSGNGAITITPPNPAVNTFAGADTYQGISIFQDRSDTKAGVVAGDGKMSLDGVIYAPAAQLTLSGNGDTLGSQVICNTLDLTGNGKILIDRADGDVHPLPQSVFLVQ